MRRAFVSHSTADDRYVAEMDSFLRAAGYDHVFNDASSIRPDEKFWPAIEQGIADADTLVVVITRASNSSAWVKREVEYARRLPRKIIPVWIEDCPVPDCFADRDVIDFRPRTREARRTDISRIFKYAPAELIGREAETKLLHDAWQKVLRLETGRPHLLTFVALGGEGKTSLVAKWAADLAAQDWPGCDAVFAWSFYSQGTREQTAVSSDLFLAAALTFFGDEAMAKSAAGGFDKGRRLAQLVGERRALLILDGLEPLQYAPTSPTPGELKDQGLAALLKGLAATSHGLCVVTTRHALPDLRAFHGQTVREEKLTRLARAAGVLLLKAHGVTGSDRPNLPHTDDAGKKEMLSEFEKLVEDVDGHALTLNLLGSYLCDAHGGDIRKRDLVKLEEANAEVQGGHAFHVMDAYVRCLDVARHSNVETAGNSTLESRATHGQRALALLRLMGLFDRPATADCLEALWKAPAIAGLTEPLFTVEEKWLGLKQTLHPITDAQRNIALKRLEDARLLTVNRDPAGTLLSLDAHPLLREYFAQQLREGRAGCPQPAAAGSDAATRSRRAEDSAPYQPAWRAAHRRLYEHLCATTKDQPDATLEDLQPLYQAVAHGCQAGLQQEARDNVWFERIRRGNEYYSMYKLGAFGSDLGAIACFFEPPWSRVSPSLKGRDQAVLLGGAAFTLRALGRLTESLEPMRAALEMGVKQEDWMNAAVRASNLSELELTLGEVAGAVGDAEQSVTYADRSGDAFQRESKRTTHADALHQAGRRAEAEARFREAEQIQAESQPAYPLLYSLQGFRYCDLLLTAAEREAWQMCMGSAGFQPVVSGILPETRERAAAKSAPGFPGDASSRAAQDARRSGQDARAPLLPACRAVSERAAQTLKWAEQNRVDILSAALDHLTLGRAALYAALLERSAAFTPLQRPNASAAPHNDGRGSGVNAALRDAATQLDAAVSGLRRAGQSDELPKALLTRAWLRRLDGPATGPGSAQEDLDEAWEIAERGPMPLFLADIHLHRARLFGRREQGAGNRGQAAGDSGQAYPWESPQHDLAEARRLIEKHGYHRRLGELEDAERALLA